MATQKKVFSSGMDKRKKDALERVANEIHMARKVKAGIEQPMMPDDDMMGEPEGAGDDAMRQEALAMMNRGNLAAKVKEPMLERRRLMMKGRR